jgi:hypothetical protein
LDQREIECRQVKLELQVEEDEVGGTCGTNGREVDRV